MLIVAALISIVMPHDRMWARKAALWAVSFALAAEATGLWSPPTWPATLLHALLAVVMLAWRRELWALVRSKMDASPGVPRWGKRSTDWDQFDSQPHAHGD
jgi:hypothetical protein